MSHPLADAMYDHDEIQGQLHSRQEQDHMNQIQPGEKCDCYLHQEKGNDLADERRNANTASSESAQPASPPNTGDTDLAIIMASYMSMAKEKGIVETDDPLVSQAVGELRVLITKKQDEARIDELKTVLHHPESLNAPRWTHQNVKDRISALQAEETS